MLGLCEALGQKGDWKGVEEQAKLVPESSNGFDDYWIAKACLELGQKDKAKLYAKNAKIKLGENNEKVVELMRDLDISQVSKKNSFFIDETAQDGSEKTQASEIAEKSSEKITQVQKEGWMSFLGSYTGRFMYAAFWIITGIMILQGADAYSKDASFKYSGLYIFIQNAYNHPLPEFMSPANVDTNQLMIVQIMAISQIILGALSAIAIPACPLFLSLLMTFITFLWNNPLQHGSMQEVYDNCGPWILNIGLIGAGLLMICEARAGKNVETVDKKGSVSDQPEKSK